MNTERLKQLDRHITQAMKAKPGEIDTTDAAYELLRTVQLARSTSIDSTHVLVPIDVLATQLAAWFDDAFQSGVQHEGAGDSAFTSGSDWAQSFLRELAAIDNIEKMTEKSK